MELVKMWLKCVKNKLNRFSENVKIVYLDNKN